LTAKVNEVFNNRRKDSTDRTLSSKLKKFGQFCTVYCLLDINQETQESELPDIGPMLLAYYVVWCTSNGITTFDSLKTYVSAVRGHARDNYLPDPTKDKFGGPDVQYVGVMKGLQRSMVVDEAKIKRTPVTKRRLDLITEASLDCDTIDPHLGLNVAACSCLAFYLLLRLGEAVCPTGKKHTINHAQRGDLRFHPTIESEVITHISFTFRVPTKSEQFRKGYEMLLFPTGTTWCPVQLLVRLYKSQPRASTGPIFDFRTVTERTRGDLPHASRKAFVKLVNYCLAAQGEVTDGTVKRPLFQAGGVLQPPSNGHTIVVSLSAREMAIRLLQAIWVRRSRNNPISSTRHGASANNGRREPWTLLRPKVMPARAAPLASLQRDLSASSAPHLGPLGGGLGLIHPSFRLKSNPHRRRCRTKPDWSQWYHQSTTPTIPTADEPAEQLLRLHLTYLLQI
jgi:hypothetical protein